MDNIKAISPLDDKIVVLGQSCSGKTTFAKKLDDRKYYCFDALFHWHLIETLGLSISSNLLDIKNTCTDDKFVLDGWHLADKDFSLLPSNAVMYLMLTNYDKIISQYRVPVSDPNEHSIMFYKWYYVPNYHAMNVRFFINDGTFTEISKDGFNSFLEQNRGIVGSFETLGMN